MTDSFEATMMARFDKINVNLEQKINIQFTPPPPEDLPSGGGLSKRLTKRLTTESTGNVQQSNLVKLFIQSQDDLAGGKNPEIQQQLQDKFDAPFVPDKKARQKFDQRLKSVVDFFNQEVPAASYAKQENTQVAVLLQSTELIQKDIKKLNIELLNRKSGQASQNEFPNKLREVSDLKDPMLTPKDSGDLQIPENVQDEEEDKKEITFVPLHFQKRSKVVFEEAPLKMRIESIAKLTLSTTVFAGQESLVKGGFSYQSTQDLLPTDDKIRQNIVNQLRDTQFDDLQANLFVDSIFQDQLQIGNFFTSKKNLKHMQIVDSEAKFMAQGSSLNRPHWYQIPTSETYQSAQDYLDIDLFRDLGPLMRQKNLQFEKVQNSYLNEISEETSPDELMLLLLSGVIPIEKIPQFNKKISEMPRSRDDSGSKNDQKAKYFKQNDLSPEDANIRFSAKSVPLPKSPYGIPASESDTSDITSQTDTESITNPDTDGTVSDSLSSLSSHGQIEGPRESVMINNVMNEIENAQQSESSSSQETAKEQEPVEKLQVNDITAKLKQKIVNDLANKKDTTPESSISPTPVNRLAAVVSESKEMKAANDKKRSINAIKHNLKKQEELLNVVWLEIKNTKQERQLVFKQKALLQPKLKGINTSINSNASNSSIIKKINSKIAHDIMQAIQCFDTIFEMNSQLRVLGQPPIPQLPLLLQKAATIEAEEIDEQTKAQFLFRIVKEIRRSVETQKKQRLEKNQQNQIQQKIKKSMPTLSPSPSPSPEKIKKSNSKGPLKQNISPPRKEDEEELRPMSRGYGVSVSYRKTQPNNFSYNSRNKHNPQTSKEEYVSIMSQSNTNRARAKPNHFKPKQTKKTPEQDVVRDDESWFSNDPHQIDQDVWI